MSQKQIKLTQYNHIEAKEIFGALPEAHQILFNQFLMESFNGPNGEFKDVKVIHIQFFLGFVMGRIAGNLIGSEICRYIRGIHDKLPQTIKYITFE